MGTLFFICGVHLMFSLVGVVPPLFDAQMYAARSRRSVGFRTKFLQSRTLTSNMPGLSLR